MKKKINLLLGVLLLAGVLAGAVFAYRLLSSTAADSAESAADTVQTNSMVGQAAPDITVTAASGQKVTLSSLRGKPVVLNFWASWCPPCQNEMPDYESLYQTYGDDAAFVMVDCVGMRSETVETGKAFLKEKGYTFPAYFDTDQSAATAYGLTSIPRSYYIDKDGVVRFYIEGSMTKQAMTNAMKKIL